MGLIGLMGLMASACPGQTNGHHFLFHQKRVISDFRIDLSPLSIWWVQAENHAREKKTNALPARPLGAWVRIKGAQNATHALGWILPYAVIESAPGVTEEKTILLKHPPEMEKAIFEALKKRCAELVSLKERMLSAAELNEGIANRAARKSEHLWDVAYASSSQRTFLDMQAGANRYSQEAGIASQRSADQVLSAIKASDQLEVIRADLKKFPSPKDYIIDFFALRTGEMYNGMPVYDLGLLVAP